MEERTVDLKAEIAERKKAEGYKMEDKSTDRISITDKIVLMGIGLGAFYWIFESALETFVLHEGNLIERLFNPGLHELWMRSLVVGIIISFSIYLKVHVKHMQAEEDYKKLQGSYQQILDITPIWFWSANPQADEIYLASPGAKMLTGYESEEFIKNPPLWLDIVLKEDHGIAFEANERARREKVTTFFECRFRHKDGSIHWMHDVVIPKLDYDGELIGLYGFAYDITQRKKAEEELLLVQFSIDNSKDGIYWTDKDARIVNANDAGCKQLGYSKEELLSKTVADIDPNFPKEKWPDHWNELKKQGSMSFETIHRHKDGRTFPVEVRLNYVKFGDTEYNFVFATDITERKKAEELLHLQSVVALNMSEGVYLVRVSDLAIVYANPKFEEMFGYDPGEMTGKHVSIINAPTAQDPVDTANKIKKALEETGFWSGDVRNIKKDGTEFWGQTSISTFNHPSYGDIYLSIQSDITERKKVEEALHESEKKYRQLFESTPVGIGIANLKGEILSANPAMMEIIGAENEDDLKTMNVGETYEDPEQRNILVEKIKESGSVRDFEVKLKRKDNRVYQALLNVDLIKLDGEKVFLTTARDITEHKKAEEELKESEKKFRASVESLMDGFAIFSSVRDNKGKIMDFRYEYINKAGCKLNQRIYEEQVGHTLLELLPAHKDTGLFDKYVQVVETGKPFAEESLSYEDEYGGSKRLNRAFSFQAFKMGDGFAANWRDVTERKQAEDKIKASLEEKEVLLSEIHHRVKNNFQLINSLLRLQSRAIKDERMHKIFMDCENRIKSMALVHEMLYQEKDLSKVDFNRYIKMLTTSLYRTYKITSDKVKIKTDSREVELKIEDAITLGLIVNELVSNSMKHAFPGARKGEIRIILKKTGADGGYELTVTDNGVGIPSSIDFRKTESLGLRLVTNLVEKQLGGTIELERDKGTEFRIKFRIGLDEEISKMGR